jgi:hypothetical protein
MICQICNKEIKSYTHIKKHKISSKEYFDTYIRKENEGYCLNCGKETTFISITNGYHDYCSKICSGIINNQKQEVKDKIKQTKLIRYGDENYHNMEKTKQTNKERYGNEYTVGAKVIIDKIKERNQELYGVDYPLQSKDIQEKTKQSLKDNYGVTNPGLSKEIQKRNKQTRIENKQKILEENDLIPTAELMTKYGIGWFHKRNELGIEIVNIGMYSYVKTEDEQKIIEYNKHHFDGHKSYIEFEIFEFVKSIYDGEILTNKRTIIPPLELDIYVPEKKVAIEINGLFYHSSLNGIDKYYHINKSKQCEEQNIRLIHIYEPEWYNDREKIENLIRIALGKVETKIYARNCTIKLIDNTIAKPFNEKGHLQGHRNAEVTYGLYYNDELVQLMSFSRTKYNRNLKSDTEWEIIRGCPASNNIVVGGVEKLFKHFIQNYNPTKIFSYCDFNKFDGKSYYAIGMTFDGYTGPDKYWIKDGQMIRRNPKLYQYYKENAEGVLWGSGSKKFVWTKEGN